MKTPVFIYLSRTKLIFGDFTTDTPIFSQLDRNNEPLTNLFPKIAEKFHQGDYHFILAPDSVYTINLDISSELSRPEIIQLVKPHIPEEFDAEQFDYLINTDQKITAIVIPKDIYIELNSLKSAYPTLNFTTSSAASHATQAGLIDETPSSTLFHQAKNSFNSSRRSQDQDQLSISIGSKPPLLSPKQLKFLGLGLSSIILLVIVIFFVISRTSSTPTTTPIPSPSATSTPAPIATTAPMDHTASTILILNSTSTAGLAKQTQGTFERAGYLKIEIGNLEEESDTTTIYSTKDLEPSFREALSKLLSPRLPVYESKIPNFDTGENKHDIVIVLGIN